MQIELPHFPADWALSNPSLIADTLSSLVWKVSLPDGSPAVVKALKPFDDVEDELRGAHYLRWRDGHGAVRLLDMAGTMMLLEHAGERLLTEHLNEFGDRAATDLAAEITARLLAPSSSPPPAGLQPLRDRFAALFDKTRAGDNQETTAQYAAAAALAEHLLTTARDLRPLHGDLHHDNVLFGPRGWLAIDPKGVLGDPAFDAANWFYNPLSRDDLCLDPERIARMATAFSRGLDRDSRTILDHAIAYGCLSAAWHAGDGNTADEMRELNVAAAIEAVRLKF